MFTIKICGITRPEDAQAAAVAGADAIGLNFYAKSPRAIDALRARAIIAALPPEIVKVGVFVNAPVEQVCQTCDTLGLDLAQLHGDESPEYLQKLDGRPAIKAFRVSAADGLRAMLTFIESCRALKCVPQLALLDAPLHVGFGGSGSLADWSLAKDYCAISDVPRLVLAGGLRPENVAAAIHATGVAAVDTASGVELQPGIKSPAKVAAFVAAAKSAY